MHTDKVAAVLWLCLILITDEQCLRHAQGSDNDMEHLMDRGVQVGCMHDGILFLKAELRLDIEV